MPSATPSHLSDEDLINKSLLASLDAQGDAEPNVADDNVHDDNTNNARYPTSLQHSRPAPDDQQDQHTSFHALHPSESAFSINQGLYSSQAQHAHQEYFHHPHHPSGAQQIQAAPSKLNGFHTAPNYRNSFTSYPNTTRSRHQATQSGLTAPSTFREQGSTFYPSQDAFSGQMTSPAIQQQYNMYDYGNQSQQHQLQPLQQQQQSLQQQQQQAVNGVHKSPYLIDSYNTSSKSSIQQQSASSQGQAYPFPNIAVQLSSQTPYGPHVPAGISVGVPPSNNANNTNSNAGIPSGLPNSVSQNMLGNNGPTTTANGEEISTIFVVGFPEDMQEREFQNMFTFSPGFEAATLKIPNKDYSAYNPLLGGSGSASGIVGAPGAQRGYGSSNDPYNLVTVNQGGMVVETGRDGMGSWPVPPQAEDLATHYAMGGMGINVLNPLNNLSLNPLSSQAQAAQNALSLTVPRKQIIGFAKFRSREEALVARDVLQGRRVDIDKGAVLKAEMAKKNLHTKRGVGLVGGVVQVGTVGQQGQGPHAAGTGLDNLGFGASEPGLARIGQWSRESGLSQTAGQAGIISTLANSQSQDGLTVNALINGKDGNGSVPLNDEEVRRRDSVSLAGGMGIPSLASLTIGGSSRGAREREEEEREKERRRRSEKDRELRMRASNSAAYDAFHAVASSSVTSSATMNGVAVIGASVTSPATNGSNATVGATAMSRQSSGASTGSLWGSPALTAATPATTIDSPSQMQTPGQTYEKPPLISIEQQYQGLHESPLEEDDTDLRAHERHLQKQFDEEEEEEEEFERMQMEQDEEAEAMHNEQMQERAQLQAQQMSDGVAVGPWDRIGGASYASVARAPAHVAGGANASSNMSATVSAHSHTHPSSSSERSTSPNGFDNTVSLGQGQGQSGYIPQFQHLQHHHEQQRQLQLQRQQFGQHHVQHSQLNHGYRTQSESSETSAIDVPVAVNPAGYVGAALSRPLGVHTNGILERLQQHTSSSSSSTSASVSTSASTSALASGSTSAFASSVSSSSSASTGTTGGSANGNGGGVSPLPLAGAGANTGSANTSAPGSAGNTSPQLPSPAGSGSTASTTSLRGTVDQNPPINTLYVGNLPTSPPPMGYPSDYLEETLREVFSSRPGYRKLCFRHKANGPMCFVEFEDVQYATKALTEMSGNTLNGVVKNGIRLSYSKNPLGVRTSNPNSAGGHTTSGNSTPSQSQQLAQALSNSNQYHGQGNAQAPPSSAGSGSDSIQSRDDMVGYQHHRLPTQILRRDSTLSPTSPTYISANNNNGVNNGGASTNGFFASAPRFFNSNPTSPGGSAQLTGASTAFVPRSSAAVNGLSMFGAYGAAAGGFSPFGMPFGGGETQSAFGPSLLHQQQSFAQHSMAEGQHPQQHQQRQADE